MTVSYPSSPSFARLIVSPILVKVHFLENRKTIITLFKYLLYLSCDALRRCRYLLWNLRWQADN